MIEYKYYPGGKRHIATFSYDDGPSEDYKLVEIFNKYGIKATFHLIGKNFDEGNGVKAEDLPTLYRGHEVAVHTEHHPWLEKCSAPTVLSEVNDNRKRLEKAVGYPVRGMSYPYGTFNDEVINAVKACDIAYSRTAGSTFGFNLPEDWYKWTGTCHHNDAEKCVDRFISALDSPWASNCLYIWGHSFEFTRNPDKGFDYIESLCKKLFEHSDKIWFATNIEIHDYIEALRSLQVAADESFVYNPTLIDVVIAKDGEILTVHSGETVRF